MNAFRATEIAIEDVKLTTFLSLIEYLYTDDMVVDVAADTNGVMDLFQASIFFCFHDENNLCLKFDLDGLGC